MFVKSITNHNRGLKHLRVQILRAVPERTWVKMYIIPIINIRNLKTIMFLKSWKNTFMNELTNNVFSAGVKNS